MKHSEHHIWCNYYLGSVKDCRMCKKLRAAYPDDDLTPDELLVKHFPDVVYLFNSDDGSPVYLNAALRRQHPPA